MVLFCQIRQGCPAFPCQLLYQSLHGALGHGVGQRPVSIYPESDSRGGSVSLILPRQSAAEPSHEAQDDSEPPIRNARGTGPGPELGRGLRAESDIIACHQFMVLNMNLRLLLGYNFTVLVNLNLRHRLRGDWQSRYLPSLPVSYNLDSQPEVWPHHLRVDLHSGNLRRGRARPGDAPGLSGPPAPPDRANCRGGDRLQLEVACQSPYRGHWPGPRHESP